MRAVRFDGDQGGEVHCAETWNAGPILSRVRPDDHPLVTTTCDLMGVARPSAEAVDCPGCLNVQQTLL